MANYYFLSTLLPELHIDVKPEIGFAELDRLMQENLTTQDYALAKTIRRYYNIENIRALWLGQELDEYGTMDEQALEEALLYPEQLPDYVEEFLEANASKEQQKRNFSALVASYFRLESSHMSGFVSQYLQFERQLRLIQTAFRAKGLKRDLMEELQFENPEEDFIAELLAQADNKTFVAPSGYESLSAVFDELGRVPLQLYSSLLEFRFQKIDSFVGPEPFSIDSILAYMVKLISLEKWQKLDRQKGISIIDRYVKDQI